jgi:hypothetical protein
VELLILWQIVSKLKCCLHSKHDFFKNLVFIGIGLINTREKETLVQGKTLGMPIYKIIGYKVKSKDYLMN